MFAEVVVNIEAPLEGTFDYRIPRDLRRRLQLGQLVEVEFGRRLAQGIVVGFVAKAEVAETKPLLNIIESRPVVVPWQIELARWMSQEYLAPLNGCLRLMLPPGLTRWADVTLDINPRWDGSGRLTPLQNHIIDILREKGDLRGRQLRRQLPKGTSKKKWTTAVNQLANREILRKATVLDPPRAKPKKIRTAALIARPKAILRALPQLGRASKQADLLYFYIAEDDPLPSRAQLLETSGAQPKHLTALLDAGLLEELPLEPENSGSPPVRLRLPQSELRHEILKLRQGTVYDAILQLLAREAQPVSISDIYAATDATISHLRKLVKLELIRFGSEEVWRDPLADRDFVPSEAPLLTEDQARAWGRVKVAMLMAEGDAEEDDPEEPPEPLLPFLLHGVTGSGKTEIYMRAIEFALEREQTAVVLVPEIALTPQTVRRFAARFPGRVAVLHSRLTDGERYDTWRRAREGMFDIIVGPRSALFAPMQNLGVIVVDEEHDASYKQTPPIPPPYYHARETAMQAGKITGAAVILGSATPDLVTYHRARANQLTLLELPRRVMGHRQRIEGQAARLQLISHYARREEDPDDALTIPLPPIEVIDLRQELRAGNRSVFSRALQVAVDETLARNEQAILFLNRRGSATFVICRECGHTMRCPNCDIPLTYHRPHLHLRCHHCGHLEPQPQDCPNCASKRIKYFGLGTEQLEELVNQRWPRARTVRWDRDTTAGRDTHEQLLASFIDHDADILVGTQMIAKGLDLPLVTLVGVISADVSLGLPDARTGERAYQTLSQVAGRAGRGLLGGRVIFQTYQPEHYALLAAADHDYISFYLEEIRFRTQHGLPPFRRQARLEFVDPVPQRAEREAVRLAKELRWHAHEKALAATEILGPNPPFFARVNGRYRWQILVRAADPLRLLHDFPIPPRWIVDIDPVSTL